MNQKIKKEKAVAIVKKLRRAGFTAYFVGGCVRDMAMRKEPKDFDIATSAKPEEILRLFKCQVYPVGVKFGTLLLVRGAIPFQVSTFRSLKGRYAASINEDVQVRDFTINALAYDPLKRTLIDLVSGKKDIRRKIIRAVGAPKLRFREDPLRLVRAVRFAATLGFRIEGNTYKAIQKLAGRIRRVSKERLRDELVLLFTGPDPARGLELLDRTGLLKYVLPEVAKLKGIQQPKAFHPEGDVFRHTALMLEKLKRPSLSLVFSCLLHDIGKPATFQISDRIRFNNHDLVGARLSDKILKRLRFANKERQDIVAAVENHMHLMAAPQMRPATLRRLLDRPTFEQELQLHRLDCLASHGDLSLWRFLKKQYARFCSAPLIPKPLVDGNELIKMGFTPGPIFGRILNTMIDLQMEGKLSSPGQARKWVLATFAKERQDA
ncbi:MAG: CCA tRNA nucleotidyltransferase [Candidatus Omnitrophota bacterium]